MIASEIKNDLAISIVEGTVEMIKGRPGDKLDTITLKCQRPLNLKKRSGNLKFPH